MTKISATILAGAMLLAGCGDDKKDAAPTSTQAPAGSNQKDDRAAALKTAIQGYANAQFAGDLAGVRGYLNPERCSQDDVDSASMAAGFMKDTAKGATIKIKAVKIVGDRGTFTDYELSPGAPDALRRLLKTNDKEHAGELGWGYVDGEWYRDAGCTGASASPSPSP